MTLGGSVPANGGLLPACCRAFAAYFWIGAPNPRCPTCLHPSPGQAFAPVRNANQRNSNKRSQAVNSLTQLNTSNGAMQWLRFSFSYSRRSPKRPYTPGAASGLPCRAAQAFTAATCRRSDASTAALKAGGSEAMRAFASATLIPAG